MDKTSISKNIATIQERVKNACVRNNRSPDAVTLIAVTKTVDSGRVIEAINAGVTDFGENYIQEARVKIPEITKISKETDIHAQWHLIGHLQSNKVKYAVELFSLIHSVDSYQLVQEIERQAAKREKIQDILVEVNLTGADQRSGIDGKDLALLVEKIFASSHTRLRGLMGIAPPVTMPDDARPYFELLRRLYESLPEANREVLSMGMSADFEAAIAEGATHVRIGSAIFGARPQI